MFTVFIQSVSSIPAFAGSPFLAAFVVALLGRIIYEYQANPAFATMATLGLAPQIAGASDLVLPPWLIADGALGLLLLLAVIENYAERDSDIRMFYDFASTNLVKPTSNTVLSFAMVQGQTVAWVEIFVQALPPEVAAFLSGHAVTASAAGADYAALAAQGGPLAWLATVVAAVWGLATGFGTWLVAQLRGAVVELIDDMDDGDSLGLLRIFRLGESGWTAVLMFVMVVMPLIALALFALTVGTMFVVRKWLEHREEKSKVACASCGAMIYPAGPFCPSCRQANADVRKVGLFGQSKAEPAGDPAEHRLSLLARKRCPVCATRLKQKAVRQNCPACDTVTFGDISQVNTYLRAIDRRYPKTVFICFLLGLIPLVGLVPGVVYYRLSLVASLRSYIPRSVGCLTRWGLRLATIVLVMLQAIPGFGALMLPLLCTMNYFVYRRVLYSCAVGGLSAAPAAAPPFGGALQLAGGPPVVPATPPAPAPTVPAEAAETAGKRFCPGCGNPRLAEARFCTGCGSPFA